PSGLPPETAALTTRRRLDRPRPGHPGAARHPGGSAMTTERRPRPRTPPGIAATTDLKRIPLPALPHFRRAGMEPGAAPATRSGPGVVAPGAPSPDPHGPPASAAGPAAPSGPVSSLEMSELLGRGHE